MAASYRVTVRLGRKGPMGDVTPAAQAVLAETVATAGLAATSAVSAASAASGAAVARVGAEQARDDAQAARDAATVNADVYASTAAGLGATSLGEQFQVIEGGFADRYRHDAGPVATLLGRYPLAETAGRLAGEGVLVLTHADFDANGRYRIGVQGPLSAQFIRTIRFPATITGPRYVVAVPSAGWEGTVIGPEVIGADQFAMLRTRFPGEGDNAADAKPGNYWFSPAEVVRLAVEGETVIRTGGLVPAEEEFARLLATPPVLEDDFTRPAPVEASRLGRPRGAWGRWHNSSEFSVVNGAAEMRTINTGVAAVRRVANSGAGFTDYAAEMLVTIGDNTDLAWTLRGPNTEFGTVPRLYVAWRRDQDNIAGGESNIRLRYAETGDTDAAGEILRDAAWAPVSGQTYRYGVMVKGREVYAFTDGRLVFHWHISAAQDAALGNSFGIMARRQFEIEGDRARIARIRVWRIAPKPADFPIIFAHRGVIDAPFGDTRFTSRNPENCISCLDRLPLGCGVEIDARQTSDGVYILMHDATVARTTTGTGTVASMTAAQVTALQVLGEGGRNVATVAEFLAACADRPDIPEILVDWKAGAHQDLIDVIEAAPAVVRDKCLYFVSSLAVAQTVRALSPTIRIAVGSRTTANTGEIPDLVAAGVEVGLTAPGAYIANRAQVAALRTAGIRPFSSTQVWHWELRAAIEDGVDGILADYPVAWIERPAIAGPAGGRGFQIRTFTDEAAFDLATPGAFELLVLLDA